MGKGACCDCGRQAELQFAITSSAVCIECGAKRGWSDKALAVYNVKVAEAKLVLSALRKRTKIESQGLSLIEEKVSLHQIGENYNELERHIEGAIGKLESYLNAVATPEEKAVLQQLEQEIHKLQDLAFGIEKEIDTRLFWLDKNERKVKLTQKAMESDDDDLEKIRQAEGSQSEVPAR
jgi:valyl-tRNA synthetase